MLPQYCATIGAVIGSLGGVYYLYDTVTGRAQPNRVTWLLWGIFPMVVFAAQRVQGVEEISWVSFGSGLMPMLVFAASFVNPKSYWKSASRDYYLMAAALLGIALWAVTDNPNLALLFSLLADMLAGIPTVIKSYLHPQSESWIAYAISAAGFGISLLSVQIYTFESAAFVIYVFLINAVCAVLASRGRNLRQTSNKDHRDSDSSHSSNNL